MRNEREATLNLLDGQVMYRVTVVPRGHPAVKHEQERESGRGEEGIRQGRSTNVGDARWPECPSRGCLPERRGPPAFWLCACSLPEHRAPSARTGWARNHLPKARCGSRAMSASAAVAWARRRQFPARFHCSRPRCWHRPGPLEAACLPRQCWPATALAVAAI